MSADNGIYVLETKDGFYVIHGQCIENIYWNGSVMTEYINPRALYEYFKDAKIFPNKTQALLYTETLYEEIIKNDFCPIVEYGIQFIYGWENKYFLKECPPCCDNPNIVSVDGNEQCYNCRSYL